MAAKITYRALGPNNDPQCGQGQANFLSDLLAVGQAIYTRLLMFQGEWWENQLDGLPLWQRILGYGGSGRSQQAISFLIQDRILGTPYVSSLSGVSFKYDPASRKYTFYCVAKSEFGALTVSGNFPQPPARTIS